MQARRSRRVEHRHHAGDHVVVPFLVIFPLVSGHLIASQGVLQIVQQAFVTVSAFLAGIGLVLSLLVGRFLLKLLGERAGKLFSPGDSHFRVVPEYSLAEARANEGKYREAVDEYRKVAAKHPDDIYPHLRIAELALDHLDDLKLAGRELTTAFRKAAGPDSMALAANRLADLYQNTWHDPSRALEVMRQLHEKIPDTNQAKLVEERIAVLEKMARGEAVPPPVPGKIPIRPSRYRMPD